MSDHRGRASDMAAMAGSDDLDALFATARAQQPPPLSDQMLQRLLADAASQHASVAPRRPKNPSIAAVLWQGLQEIFGGKQGVAGLALASCAAFAFGVLAPDTAGDLIGLSPSLELAALELDADPSVLWAEE